MLPPEDYPQISEHTLDEATKAAASFGLEQVGSRGNSRIVFRLPEDIGNQNAVVKFALQPLDFPWENGVIQNHNESRREALTPPANGFMSYLAPVLDHHPLYLWEIQPAGTPSGDRSTINVPEGTSFVEEGLIESGLPQTYLEVTPDNTASFGEETLLVDYGWWHGFDQYREYDALTDAATTLAQAILGDPEHEMMATDSEFEPAAWQA